MIRDWISCLACSHICPVGMSPGKILVIDMYWSMTSAAYVAIVLSVATIFASAGQLILGLSRRTNAESYSGACAGAGSLVSNSRYACWQVNGSNPVSAADTRGWSSSVT
jgi:hypothetical protein